MQKDGLKIYISQRGSDGQRVERIPIIPCNSPPSTRYTEFAVQMFNSKAVELEYIKDVPFGPKRTLKFHCFHSLAPALAVKVIQGR